MQRIGVSVDIDLSSNIGTGALNWESRVGSEVLFITDGSSNGRSHASAAKLMEKRHEVAQAYARHGVLNMLLAGVDVTIGSDGVGIEHSGHRQDYDVVQAIVKFWNEFNKDETWVTHGTKEHKLTDQGAWEGYKQLKTHYPEKILRAEVLMENQYNQYLFMEQR